MNHDAVPSQALSAHLAVEARCAELGLPLVHTDESGRLRRAAWAAADPRAAAALQRVIDAPLFAKAFARAVADWSDLPAPPVTPVIPGWNVAALPISERRRRTGYVAVLLLEPEAIAGEFFEALCQAAGLDRRAAADILAPLAIHTTDSVKRTTRLVQWALADRLELAAAERALDGFSVQLAESYEEINLFYRLGRAMKETPTAEDFITHLCEQVYETLAYRWVVVQFIDTPTVAARLSGRLFTSSGNDALPPNHASMLDEISAAAARIEKPETLVLAVAPDGPEVLCRAIQRDDQIVGVLVAGEKQGSDRSVSSVDMKLLDGAARLAELAVANTALYEEQQKLFLGTLEALTSAIDAKDPYTCGHSQRVSELSVRLARAVELSNAQVETIRVSGLVHDIGKIGVPERVLLKASKLTDDEFALIKLHPEIGHRILRDIPMFEDALPGVMHHHERWDGRGYPSKLAAEKIPFIARIIGVADAFDAMSSSRTYRAAMPRAVVLEEIRKNAGSQFDPELAEAFLTLDLSFYDRMLADVSRAFRNSEAA